MAVKPKPCKTCPGKKPREWYFVDPATGVEHASTDRTVVIRKRRELGANNVGLRVRYLNN